MLTRGSRLVAMGAVAGLALGSLGACVTSGGSRSSEALTTPTPLDSSQSGSQTESPVVTTAGLVLARVPSGLGCDAVTVPYRSVAFAFQDGSVVAIDDTGRVLNTFWSDGFEIGGSPPAILGPSEAAVARDGTALDIPQGEWPRLAGFFVCPSRDALFVLERDPD